MIISRPWLLVLGIVGLLVEYGYEVNLSMSLAMFSLYIISYMYEYLDNGGE